MDETSQATQQHRTETRVSNDSGYLTNTPSPANCVSAGSSKGNVYSGCSYIRDTCPRAMPLLVSHQLPKKKLGNLFLNSHIEDVDQHNTSDPFLSLQADLPGSTPHCGRTTIYTSTPECSEILDSFDELQVDCEEDTGSDAYKSNVLNFEVSTSRLEIHESVIGNKNDPDGEDFSYGLSIPTPLRIKNKFQSPNDKFAKKPRRESSSNLLSRHVKGELSSLNFDRYKYSRKSLAGSPYIDFLVQLGINGSYEFILSKLFSFLEPEDIIRMSMVSRTWKRICESDKKTNSRRLDYVERVRHSKENLDMWGCKADTRTPIRRKVLFMDIQNINENIIKPRRPQRSPPVSPSKVRFKMFVKAGGTLENGGRLVPCPRCSRPSRIQAFSTSAQCSSDGCRYCFCILCLCDSHEGQPCNVLRPLPAKQRPCFIGSKESKKNLRRL